MLSQDKHKTILIRILKEIYADPKLRTVLGFKGGTAAYLFYGLPRLSVDLDFDLLDSKKKDVVFATLNKILSEIGQLKDAREKRFTIFFLVNYEIGQRNVKLKISKRSSKSRFHAKTYLGIPVLVIKKEGMAAGKLSALLTRKRLATRDLFDLWFFLKSEWKINSDVVKEKTGLTLEKALSEAIKKVDKVGKRQMLYGLGEVLGNKQKQWVKEKLKDELIFQLRLYLSSLP